MSFHQSFVMQKLAAPLMAALLCLGAGAAAAQSSAFGCSRLQEHESGPFFEGAEGFFYRAPDVRLYLPFPDRSFDLMAQLSAALAAQGTTLIFAPVPSKSQLLPQYLPDSMRELGFDAETSIALYDLVIQSLRDRNVAVVDLLSGMADENPDGYYFHKADFHWTALGAKTAAQTVAGVLQDLPAFAALEKSDYETTLQRQEFYNTPLRQRLQTHCKDALPLVSLEEWQTVALAAAAPMLEITGAAPGVEDLTADQDDAPLDLGLGDADAGLDLFGADVIRPSVVLVGTSYSAPEQGNFAGWISQFSNLDVLNASITGGNQFGSITSYLTSQSFVEEPPHFLIWETPVYSNLLHYGDAPMRELIAAASGSCTEELPTQAFGGTGLIADLAGRELDQNSYILADAGRANFASGVFTFHSAENQTRSIQPHRKLRGRPSGRFFVSLAELQAFDATRVSIDFSRSVDASARMYFCSWKG